MSGAKNYDLICSLGGNCSAAHNLRWRGMRLFSLPFDWVYMENEEPIKYLREGFSDGFKKLCKKENLIPLPSNENHSIIYKDSYSGYIFPHLFKAVIEDSSKAYEEGFDTLKRRLDRLLNKIEQSERILFILATPFEFDEYLLLPLQKGLSEKYSTKDVDFQILQFNSSATGEYVLNDNIVVQKFHRCMNEYDFYKTNFEWSFLDRVGLNLNGEKPGPKKLLSMRIFQYKLKVLLERISNDE